MTQAVKLKYSRVENALSVDVFDFDTKELITHDTLNNIAVWLRALGYRWRWGSNGVWER